MKKRKIKQQWYFTCMFFFISINISGQQNTGTKYARGYFRNPLEIPMSLTANFGELRPNHWHMGFDLRTNQKVNLPVFAAANGYVAHIGIRPMSFGRFMIINHPNGLSTLYAHLNEFYPALENFVKEKQQQKESWAIELDFTEKMFAVKKGDFIALSGNTGGSQGPHLHFEIRDTKTSASLNASLFGFDIADNIAPIIKNLAVYDRNRSTYFQSPLLFPVIKSGKEFSLKQKTIITGNRKLSFGIEAVDKLNGLSGSNGIYGAILYFDNVPQVQYLIDNIDYNESDNVNAHVDGKLKKNKGYTIQHLSKLPGYDGKIYTDIEGTGIVELKDTAIHSVKIEVFDTDENQSELNFKIQYSDNLAGKKEKPFSGKKIIPGKVNVIEEKEFEMFAPENCFYDTLPSIYFKQNIFLAGAASALHRLNDEQYPVHSNFTVRIKPTITLSESDKEKVLMQRTSSENANKKTIRKAKWQKGWFTAEFSDFGNFQLFLDNTPPQLLPPVKEKDTLDFSPLTKIALTPSDNFGIKNFRAELDGKWLKFSNDKAKTWVYVFDAQCPFGVHQLIVKLEDLAGNITEKKWWFKRYPYTPPPKKKIIRKKKTVNSKK